MKSEGLNFLLVDKVTVCSLWYIGQNRQIGHINQVWLITYSLDSKRQERISPFCHQRNPVDTMFCMVRNDGVKLHVFLGGLSHSRASVAALETFKSALKITAGLLLILECGELEGEQSWFEDPEHFLLAGKSSQNTSILWRCGNIHYSQKVMDVWFSDEGYGKGSSYGDVVSWKFDGEAEACNLFISNNWSMKANKWLLYTTHKKATDSGGYSHILNSIFCEQ